MMDASSRCRALVRDVVRISEWGPIEVAARFARRKAHALGIGLLLVATLAGFPCVAAPWPERPVHLVVPYSPGGPNDILARILAERLAPMLGQPVVVENRAGAAGNIAMEHVARARPDGYTLVLPAMAYVVNPLLFATVPYRLEDFVPVSLVARGPLVLVVAAASPEKTLAGLIEHARSRPGAFRYGSGGNGSSPHLAAELFRFEAKLELLHIPYKGTNDVLPDLMNGSLEMAILSPLTVEQQVRAGRLRALGVTAARRLPALPDVPTLAESVPGYRMEGWYALLAPTGTPIEVIERLSREALSVLGGAEVRSRLESQGMQAAGESGLQAAEFMRAESARWQKVLRAAGITPQ